MGAVSSDKEEFVRLTDAIYEWEAGIPSSTGKGFYNHNRRYKKTYGR